MRQRWEEVAIVVPSYRWFVATGGAIYLSAASPPRALRSFRGSTTTSLASEFISTRQVKRKGGLSQSSGCEPPRGEEQAEPTVSNVVAAKPRQREIFAG